MPTVPERQPVPNFYLSVVDDTPALAVAHEIEGFDHELALLRVKLKERLDAHPEDYHLMLKSIELIVRAVAARYRMSAQNARDLAESLRDTLRRFADQILPQPVTDV